MALKNTYKIEKSNKLNEIRSTKMSLQELRFFSIYLSKINARDASTRRVRFPLSDFQKIMEIGRMNINHFKMTVNGLLCKVVHMPNDKGGLSSFQIFKEVELFKDDSDSWVVEIDAHDKALPLLFNLKKNYFTYELWNALRLKSVNQLRMYELLKQHERLGRFEIKVSELREFLYIPANSYTRFANFKIRILESCQEALSQNTDIFFSYECGKTGIGGKWLTIIFHISKNDNHRDPMELDEFIYKQPQTEHDCVPDKQPKENGYSNEELSFLAEACKNEFTEVQMEEIFSIIVVMDSFIKQKYSEACPVDDISVARYHYLLNAYSRLNTSASKTEISNRYAYFKKIILNDYVEYSLNSNSEEPSKHKDNDNCDGFDFRKYDIFVNNV
ncbi:MAG: replication initiation protein [Ruminococcus sp.]|nr:replication initiation protein [Ruminococcus sp.]MDE7226305.1 replication initiation protein [Ruminococcus sp.]